MSSPQAARRLARELDRDAPEPLNPLDEYRPGPAE